MKHIILACRVVAFLLLILTTMFGPVLLVAYIANHNGIHFSTQMLGIFLMFGVFFTVAVLSYFMEKYL